MKVERKKIIYPDFGRNVLDIYRDNNDYLILVDPDTNLPLCHILFLPCHNFVLIRLVFIIFFMESAFSVLLLTILDTLL